MTQQLLYNIINKRALGVFILLYIIHFKTHNKICVDAGGCAFNPGGNFGGVCPISNRAINIVQRAPANDLRTFAKGKPIARMILSFGF